MYRFEGCVDTGDDGDEGKVATRLTYNLLASEIQPGHTMPRSYKKRIRMDSSNVYSVFTNVATSTEGCWPLVNLDYACLPPSLISRDISFSQFMHKRIK